MSVEKAVASGQRASLLGHIAVVNQVCCFKGLTGVERNLILPSLCTCVPCDLNQLNKLDFDD